MLELDEHHDLDRSEDLAKPKFTFTECIVALTFSLVLVTLLAVFLVERIEDVVESGVPDQFLGLILLPLVEKAAEHLTAVDEAWDGQIVQSVPVIGKIHEANQNHRTLPSSTALVRPFKQRCSMPRWSSSWDGSWARIWI